MRRSSGGGVPIPASAVKDSGDMYTPDQSRREGSSRAGGSGETFGAPFAIITIFDETGLAIGDEFEELTFENVQSNNITTSTTTSFPCPRRRGCCGLLGKQCEKFHRHRGRHEWVRERDVKGSSATLLAADDIGRYGKAVLNVPPPSLSLPVHAVADAMAAWDSSFSLEPARAYPRDQKLCSTKWG